jgi:hypothetical protein
VQLVGSPQPLKSWPKQFNFKRANMAYSAGACARVEMAFATDATDLSVTHAGGDAPDFAAPGTEVCDEFNKWYFTVLATPVGKVDGSAVVSAALWCACRVCGSSWVLCVVSATGGLPLCTAVAGLIHVDSSMQVH